MSRRNRMLDDLEQDIRDHIEIETRDNIARGMPPDEARYAALRKFGNITRVQEDTREVWSFVWLEQLLQDIRFGLRMLRKSPGFTAVAVLTLALGIGANTAIFSVVSGVLLRPLPFPKQDQLTMIWERDTDGSRTNTGWPTFMDWSQGNHSFSGMAALSFWTPAFIGAHDAETLNGFRASAQFFDVMGVHPEIGRGFLPAEDVRGNNFVAVLSHSFWQRRFGGDPTVIGKPVQL